MIESHDSTKFNLKFKNLDALVQICFVTVADPDIWTVQNLIYETTQYLDDTSSIAHLRLLFCILILEPGLCCTVR